MATLAAPPGPVIPRTAAASNLTSLADHAAIPADAPPFRTLLGAFA